MFQNDPHYEREAPQYLNTRDELPWACELLIRDHLGTRRDPIKYYGLYPDFESLAKMVNNDEFRAKYKIAGARRHCISGVFVRNEGKIYKIIRIALLCADEKRVDYVDVIAESLDAVDYLGEQEIKEELFESLFIILSMKDDFQRRRESQNYFLRYNPREQ